MKMHCDTLGSDRKRAKQGFTLVEIAVALFVVVVGLMALFALIGGGLDMGAKAANDVRAGLMADSIFSTLRARSQAAAEIDRYEWEAFWTAFAGGQEPLTIPAQAAWEGTGSIVADGAWHPLELVNTSLRQSGSDDKNIESASMSYRIEVSPTTYTPSDYRVSVTLEILPNKFVPINPDDIERLMLSFYSEFTDPGDL